MAAKKRGLGRGLDALLGSVARDSTVSETGSAKDLRDIPVDLIQRGKYQPRRDIDQDALQELADSIKVQGVLQPILVRSLTADKYEIIAGERRWRASQLAGMDSIPAMVREVPDEAAIAMSLIENIQREDLGRNAGIAKAPQSRLPGRKKGSCSGVPQRSITAWRNSAGSVAKNNS